MKELKEIDILIFDILSKGLYEKLPEYKSIVDSQADSIYSSQYNIYLFMNEFATYLGNRIIEDRESSFVKTSFEYINFLGESDNCEVLNIVNVGVLEILYSEKGCDREFVKKSLSEKLKRYFDSWSKYYF
ncbi:hypothetical protein K7A41_00355 [Sphingobacterium sp. InxBP1]|uniref:DUF7674 family protein n=1 Tax=Sphingobacterium sp. InxBP1 TaxID=2870328 RepID=UPI002242F2AA|nr:hypothetical protein [Sphingobacterium sp. InxBP1]MCW8309672.1 hypothetical protein [Sphingobacterium sp. InxBP1]